MTQFVKFLREFNVNDSANSSNAESDSTHTFTEFNFGVRLGDFMSAHCRVGALGLDNTLSLSLA